MHIRDGVGATGPRGEATAPALLLMPHRNSSQPLSLQPLPHAYFQALYLPCCCYMLEGSIYSSIITDV